VIGQRRLDDIVSTMSIRRCNLNYADRVMPS
jgi:hypothetical protein